MKHKFLLALILSLTLITGCDSGNKDLDFDKVYEALEDEYSDFIKVDEETLTGAYGIDVDAFDSYLVVMEEDNTTAKMYAVFKIKEDEESLYEAEYFVSQYETSWLNGYFPDEEELVKNGEVETYGDYLIYVVNENPENIIEKIKNS